MTQRDQKELNYENPHLQLEVDKLIHIDDEAGKYQLLDQIRKDLHIPKTNLLRQDYKIYWDKGFIYIIPRK